MLKPTGPLDKNGETYSNNYTRSYSPDDPIRGRNLKGVDQEALQAKQRLQEDRGEYPGMTSCPEDGERRRHDWKATETVAKRKDRGGATFSPKDTMGCD